MAINPKELMPAAKGTRTNANPVKGSTPRNQVDVAKMSGKGQKTGSVNKNVKMPRGR